MELNLRSNGKASETPPPGMENFEETTWSKRQKIKDEPLPQRDFDRLSQFIHEHYAIKLPETKRSMVEARLRKRVQLAGRQSLSDYIEYVFSPEGQRQELINMVDCLTTNKTFFFREPEHFNILYHRLLPLILKMKQDAGSDQTIRIWCSASSTGEEPYSIAMVLSEFAEKHGHFPFSILASDLCVRVLKAAYAGIYRESQVTDVPPDLCRKYFLRSKDRALGLLQIKEKLRSYVTFRRINLKEDDFGIKEKMDIIFCRNVIIYFTREDQNELMFRFHKQLDQERFLILGHSESLAGINSPFTSFAPTIYQKE